MHERLGDSSQLGHELIVATAAVRHAAQAVMAQYNAAKSIAFAKADRSVVTGADLAAERAIRNKITSEYQQDGLLTEEGGDDLTRLDSRRVWIADPLDGTTQFVARTEDFDIFLALVVDGTPVVAVSCHPPTGRLHSAVIGHGAWVEHNGHTCPLGLAPIREAMLPRIATTRHREVEATAAAIGRATARIGLAAPTVLPGGFQARAFGDHLAAIGRYEVFVGPGRGLGASTAFSGYEWDLVATDLIVREAGGAVTDLRGRRLAYNRPDPRNIEGVVASVDPAFHERVLGALAEELDLV